MYWTTSLTEIRLAILILDSVGFIYYKDSVIYIILMTVIERGMLCYDLDVFVYWLCIMFIFRDYGMFPYWLNPEYNRGILKKRFFQIYNKTLKLFHLTLILVLFEKHLYRNCSYFCIWLSLRQLLEKWFSLKW